ncbi:Asp-tRNA(Asn)/Glu-tRNA(Gln) amidotransferase subunit GatC [Listeria sp. PSOL-1]|uniref:Asp-tRNA(Asn)/Glu-tRNA(Gln) amidotransferase subunit GatC n=1 Tax=Listeria sp. PSOL-1 TaxID=1844999 RepID=UPI0013CF551C|nr:Asp-tRNA(Asn)/Glu-tRNA(Gln) amidotransferase subunit GatC [Listeria sp. PSOL-1]
MTNISKETVEKVANLAKLEVTENEANIFAGQLGKIIEMVEKLNELDTTSVEPTSHAIEIANVLREDVSKPGLPREDVLKNAPETQDGMFKVPTIIEE